MATSSITKNFVIEGKEQAEMFANAIEEAYQDSLKRKPEKMDFKAVYVRDTEEIRNILECVYEKNRNNYTRSHR